MTKPAPMLVEGAAIAGRETNGGPDNETTWDVPLEMVLACSTSAFKSVVLQRAEAGHRPERTVRAFLRGDRMFAVVRFPPPAQWLLFPLDIWPMTGLSWYVAPGRDEARP